MRVDKWQVLDDVAVRVEVVGGGKSSLNTWGKESKVHSNEFYQRVTASGGFFSSAEIR